jgi:4-amino-4-deoxy-L-arabinose transferase-like glycosyltransferase
VFAVAGMPTLADERGSLGSQTSRPALWSIVVFLVLLIIVFLQLTLSIRRETQTWDEACHIFAGYSYWTRGDFGMNPEHPPLVKLLATLPLLNLSLKVPAHTRVFSKEEDFTTATQFVYENDAEKILFRSRMAASILTLLLAVLVFAAAREMFGTGAAFLALILFILEPTILAHGALVTTDMGLACLLFATIYAFYRYIQRPSGLRLALTGLTAGLSLAAKHSAILIFPMLVALAAYEISRQYWHKKTANTESVARTNLWKHALGRGAALWASYGFHSEPRAGVHGLSWVIEYASRLKHPVEAKLISGFARWHLLPEAYLYGLADVGITAEFSRTYLLGTIYPHGKWFYFPVAFAIKSTLALLLLLLLVPIMIALRRVERWRELLFLAFPAAVYFLVAMTSGMNIGVRHILPVYPFLIVLAGWGGWQLIQIRRYWAYALGVLLLFNVVSSVRTFPVYLAYSNELWGGPANTYKYLTDSNVDWGQQLKAVKKYLDGRHVDHCWFAYFGEVVADTVYYGIPCKPLTTIASVWLRPSIDIPATIDGPVLISAGVLSGYEFGPGSLNPYDQFQRIRPTAVIEHAVFVYDGHFDIPLSAALNHVTQAQLLADSKHLDQALSEAEAAVTLAPNSVQTQAELGEILTRLNRPDQAREAFQRALSLAETAHPEFQSGWVPGLRSALAKK